MKKVIIMSFFLIVLGNCSHAETSFSAETIKITTDIPSGFLYFQSQFVVDSIWIQRSKTGDVVFQTDVKNDQANIQSFLKEKISQDKLSNFYFITFITRDKKELLGKWFVY